jgi:hypothetical protein
MSKIMPVVRLAAFCTGFVGAAITAFAYTGAELASGAQVSIDQARAIALHIVPGEITDEELETEKGGSGLRYTFDIKWGAEMYEVGVDARTGAVLENILEGIPDGEPSTSLRNKQRLLVPPPRARAGGSPAL